MNVKLKALLDCEATSAWPYLVRGVSCLVYSDNGRDNDLITHSGLSTLSVLMGISSES